MGKTNEKTGRRKYERPSVNVEIMAMKYELLYGGGLPAGSVPPSVSMDDGYDIIDDDNPFGSSKSKGHNIWSSWDDDEGQTGLW